MSLSAQANASNEKRNQNILILKRLFNDNKILTVAHARQYFGMTESTIIKWAKDGDIPLVINNKDTVVKWTDDNQPHHLPHPSTPGDALIQYLKVTQKR